MGEGHCWQWDREGDGRRPAWFVHRRKGEVLNDEAAGLCRHQLECGAWGFPPGPWAH